MLREHRDILKEQRIHKKGNLPLGTWKPDERVVEVSVVKGHHWQHFGQTIGGKMMLQPHEALFLLEQGCLEVFFGGLPMSFQQGFMTMLSDSFSPDCYLVYAYFLRLGFSVLQHSPSLIRVPAITVSSDDTACDVDSSNKSVVSSPVSHLWTSEDGITPLVRPEDATSTAAVLSKLQVIKNQKMTDAEFVKKSSHQSLQIAFDVYQPGVKFKKTDPGRPDFCITICRYCDPPPSLASLTFLTQQCCPVPLKIALVDGGNISFYSVLDVDSPTFISKG